MPSLSFLLPAALSTLLGTPVGPTPAEPKNTRAEVGKPAPEFSLPAAPMARIVPGRKGYATFNLRDLRGKTVVLFFFPTAGSPGVAAECRGFRDLLPEFEKLDTVVMGIGTDSPAAVERLARKEQLNFPLFTDPSRKIGTDYDIIRSRGYAQRTTFIIDKNGVVLRIEREPEPQHHAEEVLRYVKEHQGDE